MLYIFATIGVVVAVIMIGSWRRAGLMEERQVREHVEWMKRLDREHVEWMKRLDDEIQSEVQETRLMIQEFRKKASVDHGFLDRMEVMNESLGRMRG